MDDTDAAAAAFGRALALDPSYAAAKLRLGFLFGRQGGKDEQALAAFSEAEHLYRTQETSRASRRRCSSAPTCSTVAIVRKKPCR